MSTLASVALASALITASVSNAAIPSKTTYTQTGGYEERLVIHLGEFGLYDTTELVDKDGNYVKRIPDTSSLTEDKPLEVCVPETAAAFALAGASLYKMKKKVLG